MPDLSFELIKSIYKKYPKWSKAILFLVLGVPLIFIGCYLLGDYGIVLIHTSLSIDGLLAYYGGFLTFIGTAILGLVTITQTQKANEETEKANNRIIELTEKQLFESKNTEKAFFIIEKAPSYNNSHDSLRNNPGLYQLNLNKPTNENIDIVIKLKNIGQYTAINFSESCLYNTADKEGYDVKLPSEDYANINTNSIVKKELHLSDFIRLLKEYDSDKLEIGFDIGYENIYGIKYKQTLYFTFENSLNNYILFLNKHLPQIIETSPKEYFDMVYNTPGIEQKSKKTEP